MKQICSMLGGSHAYGLSTPRSDIDYRGVFLNTELNKVIGLDRFEHQDIKAGDKDEFYFELRHFLNLLKGANTTVLELLFNENWIHVTPEWTIIQRNRFLLLDSKKMYSCLRGYMQSERRLANGERTGKLGGKRFEAVQQYGFSPKNFVQLFRLAWCGEIFFESGYFPVNVYDANPDFANDLSKIKLTPAQFTREELNARVDKAEKRLDAAFESRKYDYTFDVQAANEICCKLYAPIVANLNQSLKLNL